MPSIKFSSEFKGKTTFSDVLIAEEFMNDCKTEICKHSQLNIKVCFPMGLNRVQGTL